MGLLRRAYSKYQRDGILSLLYASIGFGYEKTVRPHLSCRRYPVIQDVEVRSKEQCIRALDKYIYISSIPTDHKKPNCEFIREYVDQGENVIVIGGGYGITSVVAATEVGETGDVLIYEGAKRLIDDLFSTLSVNGVASQTTVKHAIVGDAVELKGSEGSAERVSPHKLPSCDILEMDCEGAETSIIPNMPPNINTVIVETHPKKGAPTSAIKKALENREFKIVDSEPDRTSGDVLVADSTLD